MKNALSLVCMSLAGILLSTSSFAQSNTLFNPDYNGDGFIGVDDILGALSFYDNVWDGPVANVIYGCTYPLFAEYDASASVDDGSCATLAVLGCTDSSYLEYDASANVDDGSCATLAVLGCTDSSYLEYDASANVDDGSCVTLALPGCTDSFYLEYDASANVDDGSCATLAILGCTDSFYLEYDASANVDDGSCLTGICGNNVIYQGYDYATVLIGEQCWFAENLRSENYDNDDAIPSGLSNSEWSSTSSGATAVYGASAPHLEAYGRLYNWFAVNDPRGLCPSGWHVPTDVEWTILTDHLGGEPGSQMRATYGWNGYNGTNSSGFTALPGGARFYDGLYFNAGYLGNWWSSSSYHTGAWSRSLYGEYNYVFRELSSSMMGYSVRCVRAAE